MSLKSKMKDHKMCLEDRIVESQLHKARTLKRKINNAMFRSTFISQLILAAILIPGIISLTIPVGQFMTRGIALEIISRYERNDQSQPSATQKKSLSNLNMLDKMSESKLVEDIKKMDMNMPKEELSEEALILLSTDLSESLNVFIRPGTSDLKRLMIIANDQYKMGSDFFKKALPFLSIYTIHFDVDGYTFHLPTKEPMSSGIFSKQINNFVDHTTRVIEIYDSKSVKHGTIKVGIDASIITMIVVPYTLLVLGVSLVSLFIVSLLGKFMTHGILKPVNELNKQLKAMSGDDIDNLHQAQLSVKRPPREVLQMTLYTNEILHKMNEYRHLLEEQNHELLSQNDELSHSKGVIQDQQNQLVQSEKMASVGQLSAAIIHEINTPMGAIKSNSQMTQMLLDLSKPMAENSPVYKNLEKIESLTAVTLQAADRITNIVRSLKNYSRLDQSDFKETDMNDDIRSVVLLSSNLWKNKVKIVEDMANMPMVRCYSGLLNQVFMNLIVNAIDAMPEGGTLTLKTHVVDDYAVFEAIDTGTGIEPEYLSRIFDEGFTTKPKDSGSGLGLALSKAVVEKHNGSIEVDTKVGIGSTFRVIIPINPEMT